MPIRVRHTHGRGTTGFTQFSPKERGIWGSITSTSQEAMGHGECVGHMSLRRTSSSVLWPRRLMTEIGLSDWVCTASIIFSDSVTAIDWAKCGKITPGNNYLALGYHQTREWIMSGEVNPVHVRGWDNISDMGIKPVEKQDLVIGRLSQCPRGASGPT